MTKIFDQWRALADGVILHRVSDDPALRSKLLDAVAGKCCDLEERGEKASIWHALATVLNQPCHCFDCTPIRPAPRSGCGW